MASQTVHIHMLFSEIPVKASTCLISLCDFSPQAFQKMSFAVFILTCALLESSLLAGLEKERRKVVHVLGKDK